MSEPTAYPPVALAALRERTIQALCEHFAADHIDAGELERRLDRVHTATTPTTLRELTADLPAPHTGMAAAPSYTAVSSGDAVQERAVIVAVMSEATRRGGWTPARELSVVAVMGGVKLDFREAAFGPGVTRVTILAIMGGVEIHVRLPGERAADARRREKLERQEARRLGHGRRD